MVNVGDTVTGIQYNWKNVVVTEDKSESWGDGAIRVWNPETQTHGILLAGEYTIVPNPDDAFDALRAIKARLADNELVHGSRDDILKIIARVRGV
jgi:hypothetical protein